MNRNDIRAPDRSTGRAAADRFGNFGKETSDVATLFRSSSAVRPHQQAATAKRRCGGAGLSAGASANYFLLAGAFLAPVFFLADALRAAGFFFVAAFLAADFFLAGAFFADDFFEADFFAALATIVLLSMESRESTHTDIVIRLTS